MTAPDYAPHAVPDPSGERVWRPTPRRVRSVPSQVRRAAVHAVAAPPRHRRLGARDLALLHDGVRHRGLTASQAWRWHWPRAGTIALAQKRLSELKGAGLFVNVPRGRGQEGVYVPTTEGTRAVREALPLQLSPPAIPRPDQLGRLAHDLTVADVAHALLTPYRRHAGQSWLTWRELAREAAMRRPPGRRHGAAGIGFLPDGALVLATGERLAVEVELEEKLATLEGKLRWYREQLGAGRYEAAVWYCAGAAMADRYARGLRRAGFAEEEVWAEPLPAAVAAWR